MLNFCLFRHLFPFFWYPIEACKPPPRHNVRVLRYVCCEAHARNLETTWHCRK